MKKRIILGLATISAAAMLCGFDSAETAESILQKAQEAEMNCADVAMDMIINADVAINIGDGTNTSSIAVTADGDFAVGATMDPLSMGMEGTINVSLMGQAMELTMKMYGVTDENGQMNMYMYQEDSTSGQPGAWQHQVTQGVDINQLKEAAAQLDLGSLADWGIVFEVAPEAVDVEGTECYVLSTVIDNTTLETALAKAAELSGQDLSAQPEVGQALAMLSGLKINLVEYVDCETYLPIGLHMDLNDTDLSILNELVAAQMGAGEGATAEIALNNVSFDYGVAYNTGVEITVPAEAMAQ